MRKMNIFFFFLGFLYGYFFSFGFLWYVVLILKIGGFRVYNYYSNLCLVLKLNIWCYVFNKKKRYYLFFMVIFKGFLLVFKFGFFFLVEFYFYRIEDYCIFFCF